MTDEQFTANRAAWWASPAGLAETARFVGRGPSSPREVRPYTPVAAVCGCGKEFRTYHAAIDRGQGRYCSTRCAGAARRKS